MMVATPPATRQKPPKAPGSPPPPPRAKARARKTFTTAPWTGEGQGEKVVGYGNSGVGKTTLFAMMPNPIFIGLDDGGRKIRDPRTGKPITHVIGIQTFDDVRDALSQQDLFPEGSSCVIDTMTVLETLAEPYMFENILHEKGGKVTSLEGYGYGKGYTHLFETMRLILQDLDLLVRRGVNAGVICQNMAIKRANPSGLDYLEDGPKLSHPSSEKNSVRLHVCEWADHVLRIGYHGVVVLGDANAKLGKVQGTGERAIYTTPTDPSFFAKTRTLIDPVIAFAEAADDSIWLKMFHPEIGADE